MIEELGSLKGRMVDALALGEDEGRGKLRKAVGSCKQTVIRGCPNGATHPDEVWIFHECGNRTRGTETSKYPEEEKIIMIP
jgi:hypothetical protein